MARLVKFEATGPIKIDPQDKPVFVYRLVSSGSMEHKIFRRQLNKRALAQGVGDDDHQARQFSTDETAQLMDPSDLAVISEKEAPSLSLSALQRSRSSPSPPPPTLQSQL